MVLFSSVGMAKTTHICMGEEMESALGFVATHLDCGMETSSSHSNEDGKAHLEKSKCCENQSQQIQLDDETSLKKQQSQLDFNFAVAFVQVFIFGLDQESDADPTFSPYYSPPLDQDLCVLHQSFLI
ncbi:hypothetical protein A8938_0202 [Algoriphagus zhangzhouensis]|uniref:Uncharacterized protein n=2 Tax=Algoriphagus zhangzhouensis TaxID=1073327 RepID=A0A1M7Z3Y5_9BACT|nr:hypothetical protein A8938_0202 [Algoriphagus zhangzhouensis]SHO59565.1 hypothetical protein SAMN04488108_0203 [Algoriphagus zhangzhouensis]